MHEHFLAPHFVNCLAKETLAGYANPILQDNAGKIAIDYADNAKRTLKVYNQRFYDDVDDAKTKELTKRNNEKVETRKRILSVK